MRKQIGSWLLILASLAAPATASAQELQKWCAPPHTWAAPPADPQVVPSGWPANPAVPGGQAPRLYTARGQDIGNGSMVPPVDFTGPLSHPRYEDGGFFVGTEFMYWRQTRPILSQSVAFRGFVDTNGGITGTPGVYVGSKEEVLNTNMVQGPGTYQPGLNIFMGYRFKNGVSVSVEWVHLAEARYSAQAGILPPNGILGGLLENTFLYAPVANFPINYAGNPASVLVNGQPAFGSTFGIWNAASEMQIQFLQRYEQIQLNARIPVWETENYRSYGIFGPKAIIMWEQFKWRTVQRDTLGLATADTTAEYFNVTSNRLYGAFVGSGHDWYIGSNPLGSFAIDLNIDGGLYLDFVKERAGYTLGDKSTAARCATNQYSVVPGIDGKIAAMWYPWEAISIRLGYSFTALFNTYASPRPIDFNFGTINPPYSDGHNRLLHGFDIGISFVF